MDDTNPLKEDMLYVNALQNDIHWLGFEWDNLYFASDYYEHLYECAEILIQKGKAYVDDLTPDEIRDYRGSLTEAGKNSPYRDRSVEENLSLFRAMRKGEFGDGERVLRAKIDMASPNMNLRDPIMYRIMRATHYRTGDAWCIYPMYDFAHPLSDAIEGVTYSICSLEFEDHRPLYDWFVREVGLWEIPPRQIEFARLNLTQTIMSKRNLKKLVDSGVVSGWDDPRMPTIAGLRRRGYTPASIRNFCDMIGVSKSNSLVNTAMLEHCIRDDLNAKTHRMIGVIHPVKVVLDNWPEDKKETIILDNHPGQEDAGQRTLTLERELYIEQDDFMENPPKKYFRLTPDGEVRLKNAYIIRCVSVDKNDDGSIDTIHCTVDFDSKYGVEPVRKVKGTIQWLSTSEAIPAEFRLYDYLLLPEEESEGKNFLDRLNPTSLTIDHGYVEPALTKYQAGESAQLVRIGYFCADPDGSPEKPVFNRIVGLRDTWGNMQKNNK